MLGMIYAEALVWATFWEELTDTKNKRNSAPLSLRSSLPALL
jgi:hypothetical protein